MSPPAAPAAVAVPRAPARPIPGRGRALLALVRRDAVADARQLPTFLLQVLVQPALMLFIFGEVLTKLHMTAPGYATLLLPGMISVTVFVTAVQSVALPLAVDFSYSREIEDRLLAPFPAWLVAVEKVGYAAARGLLAGALITPLGLLLLSDASLRGAGWAPALGVAVLGALAGAGLGMILATSLPVSRITIVYAAILTPLLFTGCAQYPWPNLAPLRWFQVLTLANPMTYLSEALRGAFVPRVDHMPAAVAVAVLAVAAIGLGAVGIAGFRRRAVD